MSELNWKPPQPGGLPDAPLHVMLDLETMGVTPGSAVLSIGACRFELGESLNPYPTFYRAINLETCLLRGLRIEADTVKWWVQQSTDAKAVFSDPESVDLALALDAFTEWWGDRPDCIWGNSISFDGGILGAAYRACGLTPPWAFHRERCYRTIMALPGVKEATASVKNIGVAHNALDDAVNQAYKLRAAWNHLQLKV